MERTYTYVNVLAVEKNLRFFRTILAKRYLVVAFPPKNLHEKTWQMDGKNVTAKGLGDGTQIFYLISERKTKK
ncbi:MAG: hypothetical protein ACLR6B_03090 [Blautia sp.]